MPAPAGHQEPHIFKLVTRAKPSDAGLEHPRADHVTQPDGEYDENGRGAPSFSALPDEQEPNDEQRHDPIRLRGDDNPKSIPNRIGDEMIEKQEEDGIVVLQDIEEVQLISLIEWSSALERLSQMVEARRASHSSSSSTKPVLSGS